MEGWETAQRHLGAANMLQRQADSLSIMQGTKRCKMPLAGQSQSVGG